MGTVTITSSTRNQLTANYDYQKVFLFNNNYISGDYTNGTGSEATLPIGTVMGRIGASQELTPLTSAATDGSQYPVGILSQEVTVADGDTVTVNAAVSGDVNENAIALQGADTLDTLVDDRSIRDRIASDTQGIRLVVSVENTKFDN